MAKDIEERVAAIAKKLPNGAREERFEKAREINLLAELLIDMKEREDEECSNLHQGFV